VRNRPVPLGDRDDVTSARCYATALSDADKRTLAFTFFFAKLRTDPALAEKVVVLDDPVSSLDRSRRHVSMGMICELATRCRQLIVLSHDPYFIRDLHEKLGRAKPTPVIPSRHMIRAVQNEYSAFSKCDIEDVCASDYYRHHRMVSDYADGRSTASSRDVAKAIRPLLEGYYHRRFPRRVRRRMRLPGIISEVRKSVPPDPLANLLTVVDRIAGVNEYASAFHHETDAGVESAPPSDAESLTFVNRALDLIYENG
jgi:wobble nucleotide-excising tRNase